MASSVECSPPEETGRGTAGLTVVAESQLVNRWGEFRHLRFRCGADPSLHSAVILGDVRRKTTLVRVHSECLTGDVFGSLRCDCGEQLTAAFDRIRAAGRGVIIYLRGHEGRGIGLNNKLKAYALQERGVDTIEANTALGLPVDSRSYAAAAHLLKMLEVVDVVLLTNSPDKSKTLAEAGIRVRSVAMPAQPGEANAGYLWTKYARMGHRGLLAAARVESHRS